MPTVPKDPQLKTRTTTSECVNESGEPCSSKEVVHTIQEFVVSCGGPAVAGPAAVDLAAAQGIGQAAGWPLS